MCLPSPRHHAGIVGAGVATTKACSGRVSGSLSVREGRSSQLLGGAWERVKSIDRCLGGVGGGGGTGVGRLGRVV